MKKPLINKIGFQITTDCNLKCPHCIVSCSQLPGETMNPKIIKKCIDEAANLGATIVSFSGGEPFCHLDLLIDCSEYASKRGLKPEVVTNGSWGKNESYRNHILDRLAKAGMFQINVSHDVFHLPFVSSKIITGISRAAEERGILVRLFITLSRHPENINILELASLINIPVVITTVGPFGRAQNLDSRHFIQCPNEVGICPQAKIPFILVDGTVTMCCGLVEQSSSSSSIPIEGILGNVNEKDLALLLSERLLQIRSAFANYRIDELLAFCSDEKGPKMSDFVNICEACHFILSQNRLSKYEVSITRTINDHTSVNTLGSFVAKSNYKSSLKGKTVRLISGARLIRDIRIQNRGTKNEDFKDYNFLCFPNKDGYINYEILGDHILKVLESLWSGKTYILEDSNYDDNQSLEFQVDRIIAHVILMRLYQYGAVEMVK